MIVTENRKRKVREEDWVCSDPLCGNINFYYRKNCNKCGTGRNEYVPALVKVIGKKAAAKSQGIFKDQDWQCKGCGNVNWARRQKCNKCDTDKFDEINMIGEEEEEEENKAEGRETFSRGRLEGKNGNN
uniref:Zinc finger Ran-binding domain-containing protein 2 n=1 Tax=Cacopsylla melanoneura TaxID=428564 RepID=A0A8D9B6M4_9HEMI